MSIISPNLVGNDPRVHEIEEHATVHSVLLNRSVGDDGLRPQRKRPKLTRLNCLALVISIQIGSGIFSAPSLITQQVRSPAEG